MNNKSSNLNKKVNHHNKINNNNKCATIKTIKQQINK